MKLLIFVVQLLSLFSLLLASYSDYILLKSFSLVPDDDSFYFQLSTTQGAELKAAKVSRINLESDFLDALQKPGDSLNVKAKVVSINGKYKVYTPDARLVGLTFSKKKKLVKIQLLDSVVPSMDIEHLIYSEQVALTRSAFGSPCFSHRNWSLYFEMTNLTDEDVKLIREPNSVFYKVFTDIPISSTRALSLAKHSFVAFPLAGGHRFVTITIDFAECQHDLVYLIYPSCTVTFLVVDKTPVSSDILTKYSFIDNFSSYVTGTAVFFYLFISFVAAYNLPLVLRSQLRDIEERIKSLEEERIRLNNVARFDQLTRLLGEDEQTKKLLIIVSTKVSSVIYWVVIVFLMVKFDNSRVSAYGRSQPKA